MDQEGGELCPLASTLSPVGHILDWSRMKISPNGADCKTGHTLLIYLNNLAQGFKVLGIT